MTPQERDLIAALFARLAAQAQQQKDVAKDEEAEALIRGAAASQPDAPYLLVQTVLIQELALRDAEGKMADLQRQLAEAKQQTAPKPSFLGRVLGGNSTGSVPPAGPWAPPAPPVPAPRPVWTQSGANNGPWQAAPAYAPAQAYVPSYGAGYAQGGAPSFLQQAAMTAAGVAGGVLLFEGIQSMFGPHYYGSAFGGMPMQPGLSETIINNNYYNEPAGGGAGVDPNANTGFDPSFDPSFSHDAGTHDADFSSDQGVDSGSGFDGSSFDSGGDFGGGTDI